MKRSSAPSLMRSTNTRMCRGCSPTRAAMRQPSMNSRRLRILAIDPGYDRLGMAVVEGDSSRPTLVWSDCVVPPKGVRELRLARVYSETAAAIEQFVPDVLAIAAPFFCANVKTALGGAEGP